MIARSDTRWDLSEMPNLREKVAIVTGANTGMGYVAAEQLAIHGAKVYLAARSELRAQMAIEKLHRDNPIVESSRLVWLPMDLGDLSSVAEAVETFSKAEDRLDILINSAGLATNTHEVTSAGFETTIAVNHIGHFLLVNNLLPLLKTTALIKDSDVRVITVSSVAHSMFIPKGIKFDKNADLKIPGVTSGNYSGIRDKFSRYGLSKLANILFSSELQRRCDAEGVNIISAAVDPGPVSTEGGLGVWPAFLRPILSTVAFATPSKGTLPVLFLATASVVKQNPKQYQGQYLSPAFRVIKPSALAQDRQIAKNLWETTTVAVKEFLLPMA